MRSINRSPSRLTSRAVAPARNGFTVAEIAVVLVLLGALGSMVGLTLMRQQRFYRSTTELLQAREAVRDAMEVMTTDIRGMSVSDTVRLAADSAIEFFANIGSSIVCQTIGVSAVGLPGAAARRGNVLTAFLTDPDTGDYAVFLRASSDGATEWERHRILGFVERSVETVCPRTSTFSRQPDLDASATGFLLQLSAPLSPEIVAGAPVRFVRRGRYSLYHAADGRSYLGYRRCNAVGASACGAVQPVSGPYRDYSSNQRSTGLLFEYFDESVARLTPAMSPLAISRVDVTARAQSRQRIAVAGRVSVPADSATVSIAIRNR